VLVQWLLSLRSTPACLETCNRWKICFGFENRQGRLDPTVQGTEVQSMYCTLLRFLEIVEICATHLLES
jgi:hypothetical protein